MVLLIGLVVEAIAAVGTTVEHHHLLPRAPYRMNSFSYNATAGGPSCTLGYGPDGRHWRCNATASPDETVVPVDKLYPPNAYNLLNPGFCYPNGNTTENTTGLLADWLDKRGVACMAWGTCWSHGLGMGNSTNSSVDSTVITHFRNAIVGLADEGATAIGLDECGDLNGPEWGHIPGEIPGSVPVDLCNTGLQIQQIHTIG